MYVRQIHFVWTYADSKFDVRPNSEQFLQKVDK